MSNNEEDKKKDLVEDLIIENEEIEELKEKDDARVKMYNLMGVIIGLLLLMIAHNVQKHTRKKEN